MQVKNKNLQENIEAILQLTGKSFEEFVAGVVSEKICTHEDVAAFHFSNGRWTIKTKFDFNPDSVVMARKENGTETLVRLTNKISEKQWFFDNIYVRENTPTVDVDGYIYDCDNAVLSESWEDGPF